MIETWGQLSTRKLERKYISPEERQRLERVAVGRICRCKHCICCDELKAELASKKIGHKTYHLTMLGVRSKTVVRIFGAFIFFKEQTWMMKQLHMGC